MDGRFEIHGVPIDQRMLVVGIIRLAPVDLFERHLTRLGPGCETPTADKFGTYSDLAPHDDSVAQRTDRRIEGHIAVDGCIGEFDRQDERPLLGPR